MSLEIREITDKKIWEDFLLAQENPSFLQSWNSAEQSEALGDKTLRLAAFNNDELIGICLLLLIKAKRGNYIFAPYGPVFSNINEDNLQALVDYLGSWGKENGYDFIRIAPYLENTADNRKLFQNLGFKTSPIHMLSELVWYLDLGPSEEELLAAMRKTTRNLIRRAIKDGVVIEKSTSQQDVQDFIKLMKETHKRHNFIPYPDKLYEEQVKKFEQDDQVAVFTGRHENQLIAASIVMYYGKAGSYHHGASIRSKVPVAYLMQWEAIREAKRRGMKEYSFWGIVETDDKDHPFYGITLFKKGFGGQSRQLMLCQDLPLSKKYMVTFIVETLRRIKRGFGLRRG